MVDDIKTEMAGREGGQQNAPISCDDIGDYDRSLAKPETMAKERAKAPSHPNHKT